MDYDVIIVGGGPAGMGAAVECAKHNKNILLIEKEHVLGGILNQCIHNGFGLHYFKDELTGPEYAHRFINMVEGNNIDVLCDAFVTEVNTNSVTALCKNGRLHLSTKSVILAMGCREKTAGSIRLNGTRPAGVLTAGQAQRLVNYHGKLPGKNVVILGSGDIGLIMARRLTYAGAKVNMVLEIMPTSSGLARNIQQCLVDNNIPIYYNTTVTQVVGENRITGIKYAEVDSNLSPIMETEKYIDCDCLILSVGLAPENTIASNAKMLSATNSFDVNEYRETSIAGVFACGNVLQVHDLVDNVTVESFIAGDSACKYADNMLSHDDPHAVNVGDGIRYTVPSTFYGSSGDVDIYFRVANKIVRKFVVIISEDKVISYKFFMSINPGALEKISVAKDKVCGDITIEVREKI